MSRQEKKTRIRMLPPRVQLQQRDALTGSYPTNVRFSTDGRTGNYLINFDDTKTIDFNGPTLNYLTDYVMHYQRWSDEEYMGESVSGQVFKQTYVGTPYNKSYNDQVIEQNGLNPPTNSNWMIVPFGLGNVWPAGSKLFSKLNSIYFDEGVDYADTAYIDNNLPYPGIAPDKAFSISIWIYPDTVSGEQPIVSLSGPNATNNAVWQLLINNGEAELRIYSLLDSQNYIYAKTNTGVLGGDWQNITVTYDGSGNPNNIKIYYGALNGTNLEQTKITGTVGSFVSSDFDTESIRFAEWIDSSGTTFYSGFISEFIYLGKELTPDEVGFVIRAVYNTTPIITYKENGTPISQIYKFMPGIGLPNSSKWLQQPEAKDVLEITGSTIFSWGNVTSQVIDGLPFVHFTVGQEITPFRDNDQPAVDGKSNNNPFFATGSAISDVGEGFTSPLWSKNKIEIDISVAAPCSATLYISGADWGSTPLPDSTYNKSYEMLYYNFDQKIWQGIGKGIPYGFSHNGTYAGTVVPFENDAMFAFAPGIVNLQGINNNNFRNQVTGVFEWQSSAGQPFTNLGFPYHPKYHATSSQFINMSQFINEPFLVEKIIVELSAAYTIFASTYNTSSYLYTAATITSITQSTIPAAINNIFILNQRRPINYQYFERMEFTPYNTVYPLNDALITASLPINYQLSSGNTITYVDTVRDIITWGGISSFAANMPTSSFRSGIGGTSANQVFYAESGQNIIPQFENSKELMTREVSFSSSIEAHNDLTPLSWNNQVYMELPAKSPIRIDRNPEINPSNPPDNVFSLFRAGDGLMDLKYSGGGRNALGIVVPNGRNHVTPVATIQQNGSFKNQLSVGKENILIKDENRYRYNPYILLPTDNLIIGWQQPILNLLVGGTDLSATNRNSISGSFSEIKFMPSPAKITLYGSYIRENKEYNDGINQLLSSDSVHEVIE